MHQYVIILKYDSDKPLLPVDATRPVIPMLILEGGMGEPRLEGGAGRGEEEMEERGAKEFSLASERKVLQVTAGHKKHRIKSEVSEQASEYAQRSARAKRVGRSKRTNEQFERMSERTSKWPSTSVCIFGYSGPQWGGE